MAKNASDKSWSDIAKMLHKKNIQWQMMGTLAAAVTIYSLSTAFYKAGAYRQLEVIAEDCASEEQNN